MKGEILSIDTVKRIADLEKRINKAIAYIENAKMKDGRYDSRKLPVEPLLNILKGSDNND